MKKYEVLLYETQFNTLLYQVEARGEKEARRIALRNHRIDDPSDKWVTGSKIEGDKVYLVMNDVTDEESVSVTVTVDPIPFNGMVAVTNPRGK